MIRIGEEASFWVVIFFAVVGKVQHWCLYHYSLSKRTVLWSQAEIERRGKTFWYETFIQKSQFQLKNICIQHILKYNIQYLSQKVKVSKVNFTSSQSVQSVQSLSRVRLFATPWTAARQASLSITNSQSLLKLMSMELVMPSNHLILCRPLFLLPSIFSSIRVFSNESVLHIRWPEYWSFSFSISPSSEYSGLISLRMDWFNLLVVQGTLKSLLQHHSSKATILWH